MRRIALLSVHAAHNFGSMLQAYAMKTAIEKCGCQCTIIHYKNWAQEQAYSFRGNKKSFIKYTLRQTFRTLHKRSFFYKAELFETFMREYLVGQQTILRTKEEVMDELCRQKYDKIVVGSDQVWNLALEEIDDTFFLPGYADSPKVSYGASFGSGIPLIMANHDMLCAIKEFQHVSVRERLAAELLRNNGIVCSMVLDPIFLLEARDWTYLENSISPPLTSPYMFFYAFGMERDVISAAKKIAQSLNLRIVNPILHPRSAMPGFTNRYCSGPREFLSLIKNASIVYSNSFHATSFAIQNNRPFIAIKSEADAENAWDDRIATLLNITALDDRHCLPNTRLTQEFLLDIDFSAANVRIKAERQRSIIFLQNSLSE